MKRALLIAIPLILLTACASQSSGQVVQTGAPGFWLGVWHGFIFPFAFIIGLFKPDVAVYAVPNNGGWYDFGFMLGIGALTGGAGTRVKRR